MGARGFLASGSVVPLSGLDVLDFGSGAAVLCLHDAGGSARALSPLVQRLGERYRVLVPALPAVAGVEAVASMIEKSLADRQLTHLHAIVGIGAGAYRALHLVLWRELGVDMLVLLGGALASPVLAAFGPAPSLRPLASRLCAEVYLRVGERGDVAGSEEIAACTGARLDVVRGAGADLFVDDGPATLATIAAALSAFAEEAPIAPRFTTRQPTA